MSGDRYFIRDQKPEYVHNKPVEAMVADIPEHYVFISARDYYGERGLAGIDQLN